MNVEFAAPVGYEEPNRKTGGDSENKDESDEEMLQEPTGFYTFQGSGNRLDGKKKNLQLTEEEIKEKIVRTRGIPDYDYEVGYIKFWRKTPKSSNTNNAVEEEIIFNAFDGEGTSLRVAK